MHQNFQAFQQLIQPVLDELEAERRKILLKLLYAMAGGSLLGGVIFQALTPTLLGAGIAVAVVYLWLILPYYKKIKHQLIGRLVKFVSTDLDYAADAGVGEDAYRYSRLFPRRYDLFHQEDLITGMVGQTRLTVSEIHSQYRTKGAKGNQAWHTIFRGLFYILDFPKSFRDSTFVIPDNTHWLGGVGDFLQGLDGRGELVKLEDPEFERVFAVHSSNQVEARYLLSTSMMERILRLSQRGAVSLAFVDGHLYVALSSHKNLFELGHNLLKPIDGRDLAEQLANLHQVLAIVDELDLNTRIWQ
jgi:hypothetical protein